MVLDYLKRQGLAGTVTTLVTEARLDGAPDTMELLHLVETVTHMHGRNPQPGGIEQSFLRDWWGTFWTMYSARLPRRANNSSNSIASPTPTQNELAQAQAQQFAMRRALVLSAMQALGMHGRDPQTLTPDEQRLVTLTIQQQATAPRIVPTSPIMPVETPSKRKKVDSSSAPIPVQPIPQAQPTQQQILQMRALQPHTQSHTQINPPNGSRLIMPTPLPPQQQPQVRRSPKSGPQVKPKPTEPDVDEAHLLSFFGTPADWFSVPESGNNNVFEQFGNIPVAPLGAPLGASQQQLPIHPAPVQKFDVPTLRVEQVGSPKLEEPKPKIPLLMSDPNDLLQISEVPTTTEAGEAAEPIPRLTLLCDLGQHVAGTKAVSASFSHDGLLFASGGHDKRVIVFSLVTKRQLFVLEGHSQQITQVRFVPCGRHRLLATASFDKTVHVWNLGDADEAADTLTLPESPQLVLKDVHDEPIWSVDFIPTFDDTPLRLTSIDASGKLAIWDLETGVALFTTTIKTTDDRAVTVRQIKARPATSDSPAILAIANGCHVELFDCDRMALLASVLISPSVGDQKGKAVIALNWGDHSMPDHLIAATSEAVAIYELNMLRNVGTAIPAPLATLSVPADKITCCVFARGSRCALIGGYQGVYYWDYDSSRRPVKFPAHEGLVVSLSTTRSGPLVIGSASHDGWVKLWHLETSAPSNSRTPPPS
jgi:WD40 repeat protein